MDMLYAISQGAQSLRWGTTAGNLANNLPLGFACRWMAVMPGNRLIYITGDKGVSGVRHAWLAVVDTCDNAVIAELDMGLGFGGQTAVPVAAAGPRAYVAISRALGTTDTGAAGGNRIAILNVTNPRAPQLLAQNYPIPGTPFGTIHLVRSDQLLRLYTTHRSDGIVFQVDLLTSVVSQLAAPGVQPTALGLSQDGLRLFVGRRTTGDLVEIELQPLNQRAPFALSNVATGSVISIAVAGQDRVLVTGTRPSGAFPADGILNIYTRVPGGMGLLNTIDLQGHLLGQPGISPDGMTAYIPRGGQNDIAVVDLAAMTLAPGRLGTANNPLAVLALNHAASIALQASPASLITPCDVPTPITITANGACGGDLIGASVAASGLGPITITPGAPQLLPATFQVSCVSGGAGTAVFQLTGPPFSSVVVPVQCSCPVPYCFDFATFARGPLPAGATIMVGGVAIAVSATVGVPAFVPQARPPRLQLFRGTVRFQLPAPHVVQNLLVTIRRQDPESPADTLTVTFANGQTMTIPSPGGFAQGTWVIPCLLPGIREWRVQGGPETVITQVCFEATF